MNLEHRVDPPRVHKLNSGLTAASEMVDPDSHSKADPSTIVPSQDDVALRALGLSNADTGQGGEISELVRTVTEEERRRKIVVWASSGLCLAIAFLMAYAAVARAIIDPSSVAQIVALGAAFALFLPATLAVIASIPRKRLRESIRQLARLSDISHLNELFRLRRSLTDPGTTREVHKALAHTISQLKASDSDRISARTRNDISFILRGIPEPNNRMRDSAAVDFYEALIRAMEQVGDARVLKSIERISRMAGRSAVRVRLRTAAVECLPSLENRVRSENAPGTLLRAAGPESSRDLLHPANGAGNTEFETLLRAGDVTES